MAARVLKPGGTYVALFFPMDGPAGGPPYAVTEAEVLALFGARGFTLVRSERPDDSVEQRRGVGEVMIFPGPGGKFTAPRQTPYFRLQRVHPPAPKPRGRLKH